MSGIAFAERSGESLTNTQAGTVPSPVVWSAYSFRFGLSWMKARLVADSPSSWRYPEEQHSSQLNWEISGCLNAHPTGINTRLRIHH